MPKFYPKGHNRVEKPCEICGQVFASFTSQEKMTCSRECGNKLVSKRLTERYKTVPHHTAKQWVTLSCEICGKQYSVTPNRQGKSRFCGTACGRELHKGPRNTNWKGGTTPEAHLVRASPEYAQWRREIFERDNYTCVLCGTRGGYLNADHIKPFAIFKELRFELDNGRTLCVPCHSKTPTYGYGTRRLMQEVAK